MLQLIIILIIAIISRIAMMNITSTIIIGHVNIIMQSFHNVIIISCTVIIIYCYHDGHGDDMNLSIWTCTQ
jgi:hypothetical protein